ncbi:MAG: hypothetical protein KC479_09775 [Dehalococcoidia bacterium]|nr:hypothetical protein [Dehalococcoidia bacterium]MCA9845872.1 hypothetical protein [Dehalococcoidia bacterium]
MPLVILRYWFWGGVVAMLLDAVDVILIDALGLGGFGGHYHRTDKLLDSYYLALEMVVAWRWTNPWAKWTSALLFVYRSIGVVLFEVTQERIVLFIFPNLFENWWLYCAAVFQYRPGWAPTSWRTTLVPLLILLVPKMGQEYLLHFAEAKPWSWTKEHILGV